MLHNNPCSNQAKERRYHHFAHLSTKHPGATGSPRPREAQDTQGCHGQLRLSFRNTRHVTCFRVRVRVRGQGQAPWPYFLVHNTNTAEGTKKAQDSLRSPIASMQHMKSLRKRQQLSPRAVTRQRNRSKHLASVNPKPCTLTLISQTCCSFQFVTAVVAASKFLDQI